MTTDRLVHIVDDDAAIRRSLARLLRSAGLSTIAYETPQAVLEAAPSLASGCMLLDLQMPGMNGIELLGRLGELGFRLPVIVLTAHGDIRTVVTAMKAGAIDFIEKPVDDEQLLSAIDAALAGREPGGRSREAARAAELMARLSPRERQVIDESLWPAEQADRVDIEISVRTVEVHRAHMLDRLRVRNIAEAIRIAADRDAWRNALR